MDVTIVGCSGSFAGPGSPASSYLVRTEHESRTWALVLDLGAGALGSLQRHINPLAVDAFFISHLHVDHFIDLCGLYVMKKYAPLDMQGPVGRAGRPLPVHGPADTARRLVATYGTPESDDVAGVFELHDHADRAPIEVGPFTVTPHRVNHPVEGYGFRVEAGGRTLAYTGDTDTCAALDPLMTGADLVLADAAFVDGRDAIRGIHLSGRRAAEAAVSAGGVSRLMLTHLPVWNDPEVCRAQAAAVWPGEVELAEPGVTYAI